MKINYLFLVCFCLLFGAGLVFAARPDLTTEGLPSNQRATVTIPARAVEVAPGVFNLGVSEENGKAVEGYAFIHYKEGYRVGRGRPNSCNNDGICQRGESSTCNDCLNSGESSCYGFLANGAKWKVLEPFLFNPVNSWGLDPNVAFTNLVADISKWESAARKEILGDGSVTLSSLTADLDRPDNLNEIYFAGMDDPNIIGVTIVWGIFQGAPSKRQLLEWDMVFNEVDFAWSTSGDLDKMDFENIATHELGHAIGLGDLYDSACGEQTMYGYASNGETKKRTLEVGDLTGIRSLYK